MWCWWVRWERFMTDVKWGSGRGWVENIKIKRIINIKVLGCCLNFDEPIKGKLRGFLGLAISSALRIGLEDSFENKQCSRFLSFLSHSERISWIYPRQINQNASVIVENCTLAQMWNGCIVFVFVLRGCMLYALLGSCHFSSRYSCILEGYGNVLFNSLDAQILEHESEFKCYQWL